MAWSAVKGWRMILVGVCCFGIAAWIRPAGAAEMAAGELREVAGQGIFGNLAGSVARAGIKIGAQGAKATARTTAAAGAGGAMGLGLYLITNQGQIDPQRAAQAAGAGAIRGVLAAN